MTDREKQVKVIKGLEMSYTYSSVDEGNTLVPQQLVLDALALLKAQEPRVMTISRVLNLKESTPVWLEDVDKKDIMGALFMRNYTGTKCVDFAIVRDWEFERVVADYMDYGVRWRCWTSRPTDEQMEVVKWE